MLGESSSSKFCYDFGEENKVFTVRDKGWLGKKNEELLKLLTEDKFELFVIVDRNLHYQQNLKRLTITIFVLCAVDNRRKTLILHISKLFARLENVDLQNLIEIS